MDKWIDGATKATYVIGGTLVVGDLMSYLDAHAKAFGVIIGAATFLANIYFQYLRLKNEIKVKNNEEDE